MNILVFSHSSEFGGAERALFSLIKLLIKDHQIAVMLPSQKGELVDRLRSIGVKCGVLQTSQVLPTPANTFLRFYDPEVGALIEQLKLRNYDLVIANTLAALLGLLIGKELNIPCITYVHECLEDDDDLRPHGCGVKFFLGLVESLSSHILCASEYIKNSFENREKCTVLYPFSNYAEQQLNKTANTSNSNFSLLVIGTKSRRKNTHFAITVLKALRLRGVNLTLHIVGSDNSGSYKLKQQLQIRGEKNVIIHPHIPDPFEIPGKKINLICSVGEPFGLTIVEGLARGVPVVASISGGPNEILPAEFLYSVNDVDGCVRCIENVIANYEHYVLVAKDEYLRISVKNVSDVKEKIVSDVISSALKYFQVSNNDAISKLIYSFRSIRSPVIGVKEIVQNISHVSDSTESPLTVVEVEGLVDREVKNPGSAVLDDVKKFDVVPFGYSERMECLYRNGLGLAIELVANLNDASKQKMIAYIVLRLQELKMSKPDLKILCLGDGLGVDSIAFASCGFNVDYVDFDRSLMSGCAELNMQSAIDIEGVNALKLSVLTASQPPYDAIISLEVIEHVNQPYDFLKFISDNLNPGGLLFISECFEGIFDRWPTHLFSNEKYAASLPILALSLFDLEDINSLPLGKPYTFSRRTDSIQENNLHDLLDTPDFLSSYINAKMRIGF